MQQSPSITRLSQIEQSNRQAARKARTPEACAAHTAIADIAHERASELLAWLWDRGQSVKDDDLANFGHERQSTLDYRMTERTYGDFLIIRKKRSKDFVGLVKRTGYYDGNN